MKHRLWGCLLFSIATSLACPGARAADAMSGYTPPAFTDPARRQRVEAVLPELDALYADLLTSKHLPGVVYGVVLDGELIHLRALGLANLEQKTAATPATRYRIASMTKGFVALAMLKLRDEGKLRLDDPVTDYLPEFKAVRALATDSPAITIRNLMTMTSGLPEDNPWADREIEVSNAQLADLVGRGLAMSNPPNQAYEYSNLGFVLLGKIVTQVSGIRFQDYITQAILAPLGMKDTVWDYDQVPAGQLATGYRWVHDAWVTEPILHDGDSAAMSGLITTISDFARYLAFQMDAWPAREGPELGPVARATVREMQQPEIFAALDATATLTDGKTPNPAVTFYAYGLAWTRDSRGVVKLSHSGGLPGYGSYYRFAPDHGVGVMAFTNLRYGPVYAGTRTALDIVLEHANLPARTVAVSAILRTRRQQVADLIQTWDPGLASAIVAHNLFLDHPREELMAEAGEKLAQIGQVVSIGEIKPENQLRGTFPIIGEKGTLQVKFTLTPEADPKVQHIGLTVLPQP